MISLFYMYLIFIIGNLSPASFLPLFEVQINKQTENTILSLKFKWNNITIQIPTFNSYLRSKSKNPHLN